MTQKSPPFEPNQGEGGDEMAVKYLALLEKYERQGNDLQRLEEQCAEVQSLAKECAAENARLNQVVQCKDDVIKSLQEQLINLTQQLAVERQRSADDKARQDQTIHRLARKLSVLFLVIG